LDNVQADLGQNKIEANGSASPPFDLSWNINADNLSQLLPDASLDLSGQLSAKGTLKGTLEQPVLNAKVKARDLRYQQYKLGSADLIAESKQGVYSVRGDLDQLDLDQQKISDAKLDASGTIENHQLKLAFTHPDAKVTLQAQGGWKDPQWKGSLQQLVLDTKQVSKWQLQKPVQISASTDQLKTSSFCLSNRSAHTCSTVQWSAKTGVNVEGDLKQTPLALLNPFLPSDLILKGSANGRYKVKQQGDKIVADVALQLPAGLVSYGKGKNKQLLDYQSLTLKAIIDGQKITAKGKLLLKNKGELSADATVLLDPKGNHQQIDARGKLNRIPLAMAKPWLPETLTLNGTANGGFKLKQTRGKTTGNLIVQLPRSSLSIMDEAGSLTKFDYQNAFVKASINNKIITASSKMQLNGRGNFTADAKILLGANSKAHRIQGSAAFDIPNINWMQPFVPQTTHLYGRVSSKISFNGRLTAPKIIGQIALQDASLKLPKVGTHLRHINLTVRANDANRAIINGSLISGQGKATLTGFVSLKDPKKLNAEMRLRGKNLQFVNTHEAIAVMNPDITVKMNPKTVDILGKIHIPTAKITLNAIPESSIDESEDVIVIGEKKPDGNFSAVKIRPNIMVSLGNQVKFQGFGLDTKLGGSVRVTHNHQVIVTQGSIKINKGRYQAYGQNLTINNGRLVFNGPPTHIGMDIKAVRQIDDINAGIHLTGTLRKPKTKLFSSPSLSESNILSYLLTGHSMDEITGSQTALLMQAVRSMNVTGGEGIERSIGNSLGLDDLSIIPKDDLKKSELRLGKKLGSKLYVRYIVGIFDAAQKIALEYKVNKYLNLEAQAGADAQSLDLIYQVETD